MSQFPQSFRWEHRQFVQFTPDRAAVLLVADSWRVSHGRVWGLADHVRRFLIGLAAQSHEVSGVPTVDAEELHAALEITLASVATSQSEHTELFPRVSVEYHAGSWQLVLLVRPAPPVRPTTRLWIPKYTDPRTRPTVKGPDIDLMRGLVSEAPTDDVVLHDGTNVIETTTGALLVWPTPEQLVLCAAPQQLASISAQRIATHARSRNIAVTTRPVTIQDMATGKYPVWFANTLHGISPVTTLHSDAGEQRVAAHPDAARWQAAWWKRFSWG